ncbi:hypothetical protein ACWPMX_00735 [Tsuneonella sp. HG094]
MKTLPLLLVAALAACQPAPETAPEGEASATGAAPSGNTSPPGASDTAPAPVASASPATPPRFEPPVLTPDAEKGEKGARNVLLSWGAAMENRDFAAASALFGGGRSDANDYKGYRDITVGFGDGDVEGGAGSLYYQVPVWLTATGPKEPVRREGSITLRRVNDVDGATPAQLRWHIDSLNW